MTSELPYTLIAELTYRCPLRCPYCSNPTDYRAHGAELATDTWREAFAEARELGVLQLHLTGGEPLSRQDLETLVKHAAGRGLFVNLITSGLPASQARVRALAEAGLSAVQVSIQSARPKTADRIAGHDAFALKRQFMDWARDADLPLTLNVVLHRENLHEIDALVDLAQEVGAHRLELANVQYQGWALENRDLLLPSRAALVTAHGRAERAAEQLKGALDVVFVAPDYHAHFPRACMDGWARRYLHIAPDGVVLPCHAARTLGLPLERIPARSLAWIWHQSTAFNAFRGEAWMRSPCRECSRRDVDFGGCRCQAFALTGDATAADPACALSPDHDRVLEARRGALITTKRRYLHRGAPERSS